MNSTYRTKVILCLTLLAGILFRTAIHAQYLYPFQNPDLEAEKRIDNIISLLTLDEKIVCLGTNPSIPRLGIKGSGHIEGLHGVALGGPGGWGRRKLVTTTTFPQAYGMAETWDTALVRKVANVEGYEARYIFQSEKYNTGGLVVRAPNADLGRDPRWGRTEECYGEDAYFNGLMTQAYVKGLQGDHPKYWQVASLMKHFLANSNENDRVRSTSDFDERLFREYYALPFKMGIEAGSRAYMAAYNKYNGIPMMVHPILKEVTVKEWGQNGIICTDGGALRLLWKEHKYYPDSTWAAAAGVKAGINQFLDQHTGSIQKAIQEGILKEGDIDEVIRGNFRVMIKLGLLDPPGMVPYASIKDGAEPWLSEQNKELVREVTRKSIVLLKNEDGFLPLNKNSIKSIVIIGPYANQVLLDWYSGTPPYTISVEEGIRKKLGAGVDVQWTTGQNTDSVQMLASKADYVLMVVGNHTWCNAGWELCPTPSDGKEAVDRRFIYLEQEELIKKVYRINPKVIVALLASFPYAITWTQHNISAILHMTHNSQEQGAALADVLFGDYNPGGKLVQTWPRSMEQLPPMMDYNIRNGRTYQYFKGTPLYPFGYGLSYTTFFLSDFNTSANDIKRNGVITVNVRIKNTGKLKGDEVVQLYIQHLNSEVARPQKELKAFQRINLSPGEQKNVQLKLTADQLRYWDETTHSFVLEEDKVKLMVGTSSADIKFQKVLSVIK
ncbi:glycoside hydrolase family 3 C-terminal domain-containing protein [Chitinophagaceae bacterium LB-8]|uniref:Glycoside hydrolase family 3 C-terminal domain-containing protein n=1 Tax=Paraflavisolibacter caeni TaxID=2982496 RepID=A0A9X2XX58_9BACT|nr:glycoside hydrolase family 3 C-terminal domain-containing protein [Paraflavisolibacter caeni]MCU7550172.1 glycoside hydrolase family 3 C-terminal domain-containing protein [Paraflavisolibacter caeni]